MPRVNPTILAWARETAGLSLEDAARQLQISDLGKKSIKAADRLAGYESGQEDPSRALLSRMAKVYRRPTLTFYLPSPPARADRGEDFRTLPEKEDISGASLVDAALRDIRVRQMLLRGAMEEADDIAPLPFVGSASTDQPVVAVATAIVKNIEFDRSRFRQQRDAGAAFGYLRGLVEARGIFVILISDMGSAHSRIDVGVFRGFALADPFVPFVAINANDSQAAWSFTLGHELAHIWLGASGVSGGGAITGVVEQFCNDVASEILLPQAELLEIADRAKMPDANVADIIGEAASTLSVSNTMVAYRLYRADIISINEFDSLRSDFRAHFLEWKSAQKEKNADRAGGPPYYAVRKHRAGGALVRVVDRMVGNGVLSATKAGKVLGVGANNVYKLLEKSRPQPTAGGR